VQGPAALLQPHPQFLIIKAVVFLTYWQVGQAPTAGSPVPCGTGTFARRGSFALIAQHLLWVSVKRGEVLWWARPPKPLLFVRCDVWPQGVLIFAVGEVGWVQGGPEDAADLQNVLICVEMALGAVGFLHAFPYAPYMQSNMGGSATSLSSDAPPNTRGSPRASQHAINLHDVVSDTVSTQVGASTHC